MDGSRGTISLAVALLLIVVGCTSSPWSALRAKPDGADTSTAEAAADQDESKEPTAAADADGAQASEASSDAEESGVPEARELNSLMAELQQLGALDPEAQQQLMEDLRQTDPTMWKPVLARFRAALAYRRRSERRGQERFDEDSAAFCDRSDVNRPTELGDVVAEPDPPRHIPGPVKPRSAEREDKQPSVLAGRSPLPETESRVPVHAPAEEPKASPVARKATCAEDRRDLTEAPASPEASDGRRVVRAAHNAAAETDWNERLAATIRALESDLGSKAESDVEVSRHAHLRLLYMVAGRRDDALRPLPADSSATQDFWANEIYGLAGWLDADRTADPQARAAEAKKSFEDALGKLGEVAPVVVKGMAFCTAIQSYGCYTRFEKNEFVPGQEVLLYAEVENFKSERMPKGYHTALRSSYKIFDSRGQQVAEHEFPLTEEFCQSQRRDFFIGYHLRLPERIFAGEHTLRLTIEDLKKGQVGQASIELTVRAAE